MKHLKLLLLLIFTSKNIIGSTVDTIQHHKPYITTEFYYLQPVYFLESSYTQKNNYGAGVAITENFKPFKITLAYQLNSKNYKSNDGKNYHINFQSIMLLATFKLVQFNNKKHTLSLTAGVVNNILLNYEASSPLTNGANLIERSTNTTNHSAVRLGVTITHQLNTSYSLIIAPFIERLNQIPYYDLKYINIPPYPYAPKYNLNYSRDKYWIGIKLGLEYKLKKRKTERT